MNTEWPQLHPAIDQDDRIRLAHGGGGQLTDELLRSTVLPHLRNDLLEELLDAAVLPPIDGRIALTIDSYVVQPLFFPGGDIGRLAISGTVNDLAVIGARPLAIALSLILTEGMERETLDSVMRSVRKTADEAGVRVVTGDTKVVGHGHGDGIFITTAGIGVVPNGRRLHPDRISAGDQILLSGAIADHGLAVMLAREMPEVISVIRSDAAPLNHLIDRLLAAVPNVKFLRDPTRGGLAGLAADLAERTELHIRLDESAIRIRPETLHAAEMLGLDPLDVANEGKVVAVVAPGDADLAIAALRADPLGRDAAIIGAVEDIRDGVCEILTTLGGRRIIQKPYGEQLPRIC
jgi:hydrogenase expression/formation protein HypE